jgi:predicted transcriptional regulator
MNRTTIHLDDELQERLRKHAEITGQTQSAIVREALVAALDRSEAMPYPRSVGLADGGPSTTDLSDRVDELLAEGFGEDQW